MNAEPSIDEADEENDFWRLVSQSSLDATWNNEEDDVYAELLHDDASNEGSR